MQMRFPNRSAPGKARSMHHMTLLDGEMVVDAAAKARSMHHMTLLDGEMVVDCNVTTGKQTRRFLAYDLMTLNMRSLATRPFKARPSTMPACRRMMALVRDMQSSLGPPQGHSVLPCHCWTPLRCLTHLSSVLYLMLSCGGIAGALCHA